MKHRIFLEIWLLLLCSPIFLFAQHTTVQLPKHITESSALEWATDSSLYTINDSGNDPELYEIHLDGRLLRTIDLEDFGVRNKDWESLAQDALYLYIGDFGNNWNTRKDLVVYKISKAQLRRGWGKAGEIHFKCSEQQSYPPQPEALQYDFEGFYATTTELVLWSKNRTEPCNGYAREYHLSKNPGHYTISAQDSIYLHGASMFEQWVAGADYHPGKKLTALLSGPSIHFLVPNAHGIMEDLPVWAGISQKESILFGKGTTLYVSDEVNHLSTGKLYAYDYAPWLEALETFRNSPAKVLQKQVKRTEKLVLSIQYMNQTRVPITITSKDGHTVHEEVFTSTYYPRLLGSTHTIIQGKTLLLPVANWGLGSYNVLIEHPFGTVNQTVTIVP